MINKQKRCFLGLEIMAPWPKYLKYNITEQNRHITLAFLNNLSEEQINKIITTAPTFPINLVSIGLFDKCLFLPEKNPHLVAWHIKWLQNKKMQQLLHVTFLWLKELGFTFEEKDFLWHVTLCRKHFKIADWQKQFVPLPLIVKKLHLYESLGSSTYRSLWHNSFLMPFEEKEHTADIAFIIRGENFNELYHNAQIALCFYHNKIFPYLQLNQKEKTNIDEVIISLNEIITIIDREIGSPFKAVSFHSNITTSKQNLLQWEMIVDV